MAIHDTAIKQQWFSTVSRRLPTAVFPSASSEPTANIPDLAEGHARMFEIGNHIGAAITTLVLVTTGFGASPSGGYPASCTEFRISHIQRDYGAALEWSLSHECYFGQPTEVVVTTLADGAVVDRHTLTASTLHGRSARYVLLPQKPICAATRVRVEARYGDGAIGDFVSSEGLLYFDPDDSC